jgi:hypothetical protein
MAALQLGAPADQTPQIRKGPPLKSSSTLKLLQLDNDQPESLSRSIWVTLGPFVNIAGAHLTWAHFSALQFPTNQNHEHGGTQVRMTKLKSSDRQHEGANVQIVKAKFAGHRGMNALLQWCAGALR